MMKVLEMLTGAASGPPKDGPYAALVKFRTMGDRLRSELAAAKAEDARLLKAKASRNDELRSAVENGDAVAREQLVAQLGKLNADIEANRTRVEVTEGALAAAEAALSEAVAAERRGRAKAALEETEAALRAERASHGPSAVAFFESRGRVIELQERVSRLRRACLAMGVQGLSRPGDGGPVPTLVEITTNAVRAKHGEKVCFDDGDVRALGAYVRGLVGPEPEL